MRYNINYSKFEKSFKILMNIETLNSIKIVDNSIIYNSQYSTISEDDIYNKEISVNDYFFVCKKYAIENGFQIISGFSCNQAFRNSDELAYCKVLYEDSEFQNCDMYFMSETEQGAVIDAIYYVLQQLKQINEITNE
jgi:hypothetical protein